MSLVVAIDGPGGVGKSTVARLLAQQLGVSYVDTGATYRALALAATRGGFDPTEGEPLARFVEALDMELAPSGGGGTRVLLDGEPIDDSELRTPEVARASSRFAALPSVRRRLSALQREFARRHGGVLEGRDIGTVVYPETPHRYYFDASLEVRAERRWRELVASGSTLALEDVRRDIEERDRRDSERAAAPLRRDAGYRIVDTGSEPAEAIAARLSAEICATPAPS